MKLSQIVTAFLMLAIFQVSAEPASKEWKKRYQVITNEVCSKVKGECLVRFSAYKKDKAGLPVNNLHFIAVPGKVVVVERHGPSWGNGKDYKSAVRTNPTWLDLAVIANDMIHKTGDRRHIYLEDCEVVSIKNGIKYVELYMGS